MFSKGYLYVNIKMFFILQKEYNGNISTSAQIIIYAVV